MLAELAPAGRVGATTGFAITFTVTSVTLTPPVLGLVADHAPGPTGRSGSSSTGLLDARVRSGTYGARAA